jgi:alkylated DNA repair dioxygenase AlkB
MEYYRYYPKLIDETYFAELLPHFLNLCKVRTVKIRGKTLLTRRISCVYSDVQFDYGDGQFEPAPRFPWADAPKALLEIKEKLENLLGYKVDYILVHIYRDGSDYIGFHSDGEAQNSEVYSVSLGATRRFQFRPINDKKHTDEYHLSNGDVVHMFGPRPNQPSCQMMFKHAVPKMDIKDLCDHITSHNIPLPTGRKTYQTLQAIIEEHDIIPLRINMTFRQFET